MLQNFSARNKSQNFFIIIQLMLKKYCVFEAQKADFKRVVLSRELVFPIFPKKLNLLQKTQILNLKFQT
jgi:hypothetical protein